MARTTKSNARTATARSISGHNVAVQSHFAISTGTAPENRVGAALAGSQPNTDRRRYLVSGDKRAAK